jgi:hypothetical protein
MYRKTTKPFSITQNASSYMSHSMRFYQSTLNLTAANNPQILTAERPHNIQLPQTTKPACHSPKISAIAQSTSTGT